MKAFALLGKGALIAGVAAAGLGSGRWVNQTVHQSARPYASPAAVRPAPDPGPAAATTESLLHYQFIRGERLHYALEADIRGTGIESLAGSSDVAMRFQSAMQVLTESVDALGNGNLEIRFTEIQMQGTFMDEPVRLTHSMRGTEYRHGREHIRTAAGDSIRGIPQLEFFNEPTRARVSPAGVVLEVSGAPGMQQMLAPEKLLTTVQFPDADLDQGATWESEFAMPVPGVGALVPAKTVNELVGFELYRGRYCALIRQRFGAAEENGALVSPPSALGGEMQFSMPEFRVEGENLLYFDVDGGKLVDAQLDLAFTMRVGQELEAVTKLLGIYGDLLNELEGSTPNAAEPAEDLLELGLRINGRLALLDE